MRVCAKHDQFRKIRCPARRGRCRASSSLPRALLPLCRGTLLSLSAATESAGSSAPLFSLLPPFPNPVPLIQLTLQLPPSLSQISFSRIYLHARVRVHE